MKNPAQIPYFRAGKPVAHRPQFSFLRLQPVVFPLKFLERRCEGFHSKADAHSAATLLAFRNVCVLGKRTE